MTVVEERDRTLRMQLAVEVREHLVAVHPVEGTPDCHQPKRGEILRKVEGASARHLDMNTGRVSRGHSGVEHFRFGINGYNPHFCPGERNREQTRPTTQVQDVVTACQSRESDNAVNERIGIGKPELRVIRYGRPETAGLEALGLAHRSGPTTLF